MPHSRINRQVFENDKLLSPNDGWYSNLLNIAKSINMENLVANGQPMAIASVKTKLCDIYNVTLREAIANKPKLVTYNKLIAINDGRGYLEANLDKHKRSLLC